MVVGHVAARLPREWDLGQRSEHTSVWSSEVEQLTCSPPRLGFRLRQGRWQMHIFCPAEGGGTSHTDDVMLANSYLLAS